MSNTILSFSQDQMIHFKNWYENRKPGTETTRHEQLIYEKINNNIWICRRCREVLKSHTKYTPKTIQETLTCPKCGFVKKTWQKRIGM